MASPSAPPPPPISQYTLFGASNGSSFTQISQVAVAGVFVLIFILASVILVKAIRLRFARRRGDDLPASNMTFFQNDGGNHTGLGLDDSAVEALGTTYSFTAETGEKGEVSAGEVADGADVEAGEAGETRNASLRECSVCLEEFKEGQTCRTLAKCGHSFHQTCIDKWAKRHASCPLCRISLLQDAKVEEEPHTIADGLSHSVPAVTVEEGGQVSR